MTLTEVLSAAEGIPWLAAAALGLGAVSWAVEKVAGLSGPATALARAWSNRELRRLRREALLRAERRRIAADEEAGRIADLSAQLAELREEVQHLRADRDAARRREARTERYAHELAQYGWRLLHAARAAGLVYVDPPDLPQPGLTDPGRRNHAPAVPAPR